MKKPGLWVLYTQISNKLAHIPEQLYVSEMHLFFGRMGFDRPCRLRGLKGQSTEAETVGRDLEPSDFCLSAIHLPNLSGHVQGLVAAVGFFKRNLIQKISEKHWTAFLAH